MLDPSWAAREAQRAGCLACVSTWAMDKSVSCALSPACTGQPRGRATALFMSEPAGADVLAWQIEQVRALESYLVRGVESWPGGGQGGGSRIRGEEL